jgi:large subunit ribosomal protein L28
MVIADRSRHAHPEERQRVRVMKQCDVCGKTPKFGNQFTHRGLAKYKGGVGIKTTGVSRRQFQPNLQNLRVEEKNGAVHRARVCTRCIKSGVVKKPLKREIPEGVRARMQAREEAKLPEARRKRAKKRADARRQRVATIKAKIAAKKTGGSGKAPPAPPAAPKGKK